MRAVTGLGFLALLASLGILGVAQAAPIDGYYNDGLIAELPEQDIQFKLKGRIQADYNRTSLEGETLENSADVRRVWMTFSGHVKDWHFLSRFDLDQNDASIPLATYLEYRGLGDAAWISFGRHKEPFGMSWVSSIKDVTIPERSAISDRYSLGRSVGVQLRGRQHLLHYTLGLFEDGSSTGTEAEHVALTGRLFSPLLQTDERIMHIGVGFSQRQARDVYGLEFAYVERRWHVQSEYMAERLDENGEHSSGLYFETGYFLTADSMRYQGGVFKGVQPNSPDGAWQAVFRVDEGDGDFSDIELGVADARSYTVGLNYFANDFFRVSASYMWGELKDGAELGSELSGDELRLRAQFVF